MQSRTGAPALALCSLVFALAGCGGGGKPLPLATAVRRAAVHACGRTHGPPRHYDHVVWIVMENHAYGQIIGSPEAPFLSAVARECGVATDYHAITHPSLPNYIALTSGSTHGISDDADPSSHKLGGPSVFSQVGDWRSLQESMPSKCDKSGAGEYAPKHNPAAYYVALGGCAERDVPLEPRTPDLSARFTFITPNLIHDMHDGSVQQADTWLSTFLPRVLRSHEYRAGRTAVYITWDEDDDGHANHVATIVIAPSVKPGTRSTTPFSHYSLLRTTEEQLGLSPLAGARGARSMRAAFGV